MNSSAQNAPAPAVTPASSYKAVRAKKRSLSRLKEPALAYLFLAPSILLFGLFLLYPLMRSLYLSLFLTDPRGHIAAYVGFDNFRQLLTSSSFWSSLAVTGKFALITVPGGLLLGLIMSALAHSRLKGMRIFQFIFSLPLALSVSTSAVIWMMLFHPTLGMFNYFLDLAGFPAVQWLTDPKWALLSISVMTIWMNSGFNFIVLLSGLQGIPEDMYDSAKVDGAGPVRTFVRIILPLLSPVVFFLKVVSLIGAFQAFGQMHILTKGGPAGSTEVLVYSIYKEAFVNYQFGTGSAMAIVLFVLIMILTLIQFTLVEKKVHYQ